MAMKTFTLSDLAQADAAFWESLFRSDDEFEINMPDEPNLFMDIQGLLRELEGCANDRTWFHRVKTAWKFKHFLNCVGRSREAGFREIVERDAGLLKVRFVRQS